MSSISSATHGAEVSESEWAKLRLPVLGASDVGTILAPPPLPKFTSINARLTAEDEKAVKAQDNSAPNCSQPLPVLNGWPIRYFLHEDPLVFRPDVVERGIGACSRYSPPEAPNKSQAKSYSEEIKDGISLYGLPKH
jgi:hypothetical protein